MSSHARCTSSLRLCTISQHLFITLLPLCTAWRSRFIATALTAGSMDITKSIISFSTTTAKVMRPFITSVESLRA